MKKLILIALLATWTLAVKAQSPPADRGVILLKYFYSAYITLFSGESGNLEANEKKLAALRRKYCTPACLKQYRRLIQDTDADPIIKGQDSYKELVSTLTISKDPKVPGRYAVTYTDIKGSHEKTTIYVTLVEQEGTLKIAYLA